MLHYLAHLFRPFVHLNDNLEDLSVGKIEPVVKYYNNNPDPDTITDYFALLQNRKLPTLGFYYVNTICYVNRDNNRLQIAWPYNVITTKPHYRLRYTNGTWSAWQQIITNADLANYLPLTGGRINGPIRIKEEAIYSYRTYDGAEYYSYMIPYNFGEGDYKSTRLCIGKPGLELAFLDIASTGVYHTYNQAAHKLAEEAYVNSLEVRISALESK